MYIHRIGSSLRTHDNEHGMFQTIVNRCLGLQVTYPFFSFFYNCTNNYIDYVVLCKKITTTTPIMCLNTLGRCHNYHSSQQRQNSGSNNLHRARDALVRAFFFFFSYYTNQDVYLQLICTRTATTVTNNIYESQCSTQIKDRKVLDITTTLTVLSRRCFKLLATMRRR